jgi:hypothetical protein
MCVVGMHVGPAMAHVLYFRREVQVRWVFHAGWFVGGTRYPVFRGKNVSGSRSTIKEAGRVKVRLLFACTSPSTYSLPW